MPKVNEEIIEENGYVYRFVIDEQFIYLQRKEIQSTGQQSIIFELDTTGCIQMSYNWSYWCDIGGQVKYFNTIRELYQKALTELFSMRMLKIFNEKIKAFVGYHRLTGKLKDERFMDRQYR